MDTGNTLSKGTIKTGNCIVRRYRNDQESWIYYKVEDILKDATIRPEDSLTGDLKLMVKAGGEPFAHKLAVGAFMIDNSGRFNLYGLVEFKKDGEIILGKTASIGLDVEVAYELNYMKVVGNINPLGNLRPLPSDCWFDPGVQPGPTYDGPGRYSFVFTTVGGPVRVARGSHYFGDSSAQDLRGKWTSLLPAPATNIDGVFGNIVWTKEL